MPGKHVHFAVDAVYGCYHVKHLPFSSSAETEPIAAPPLSYIGSPYTYSPLPSVPAAIHPLLAVSNSPSLIYDMSRHISSLRPSNPSLSPHLLDEPATLPRMPSLTIICPHLPWRINLKARQQNGYITVADVMDGLYHALRLSSTEAEFRSLLSYDLKQNVSEAYRQRYRRASHVMEYKHEKAQGLRRVDFLRGKNTFMGLSSTGGGVWRLNVS